MSKHRGKMKLCYGTSPVNGASSELATNFHHPLTSASSQTSPFPSQLPLPTEAERKTFRNAQTPSVVVPLQTREDRVAVILPISQLPLLQQHVRTSNAQSIAARGIKIDINNSRFVSGTETLGASNFNHRTRSDPMQFERLRQNLACRSAGSSPFNPRQRVMGSPGMRTQLRQAISRLEAEVGRDCTLESVIQGQFPFDIDRKRHLELSGLDRACTIDAPAKMRVDVGQRPLSEPPSTAEQARSEIKKEILLELRRQKRLHNSLKAQERSPSYQSTPNRQKIFDMVKEQDSSNRAREWQRLYQCMMRSSRSHDPVATSMPKTGLHKRDKLYELLCRTESSRRIMLNLLEGKRIAVESSGDDDSSGESSSTTSEASKKRKRGGSDSDPYGCKIHLDAPTCDDRVQLITAADNLKMSPLSKVERRDSTGSDTTVTSISSASNSKPSSQGKRSFETNFQNRKNADEVFVEQKSMRESASASEEDSASAACVEVQVVSQLASMKAEEKTFYHSQPQPNELVCDSEGAMEKRVPSAKPSKNPTEKDSASSMKLLALAQIACARVECREGESPESEKNVYRARAG